MSALYAIGDIHGELHMLEALADRVPFEKEDEIVFLGDYIDRGQDSRGVVEFVIEFRRAYPNTVCLRGNHEDIFMDYLSGGGRYAPSDYLLSGTTFIDYGFDFGDKVRLPPSHQEFFDSLAWCHQSGGFIFVHAGLRPGVPLDEQDLMDLIWIREDFYEAGHDFGKPVVFGHSPAREIRNELPLLLGIDTCAVYGGSLTCVRLADKQIVDCYQVSSLEVG